MLKEDVNLIMHDHLCDNSFRLAVQRPELATMLKCTPVDEA